jgi:3-hydroxybutyryl-CoA dehydrogenase
MELTNVGVVGAGVIGTTVAQDLAQTGHGVALVDTDEAVLAHALDAIASSVRLHHLVSGGERQKVTDVLTRVAPTTDYSALADVDFVIENTTEDPEIKRLVYHRLDDALSPDCVVGANTSVIPITTIGSYTKRPQNVVGIHFMNPSPLKPAVELIRGERTSDEAVAAAHTLLTQMRKRAIEVGDSPGFVSNRVLMQMINEAAFLVHEGVASPRQIDDVFKSCFGHKMGPLETADLIGLDTILRSVEGLEAGLNDNKYRPSPLLREMVDAGRLGRKSGRGFHTYGTHESGEGR